MGRCNSRTPLLFYKGIIMKWRANSKTVHLRHYEIKHDPMVGFYLYVFEGEKCIRDYLQDTLEIAMECALKNFGVPNDAWIQSEEKTDYSTTLDSSPKNGDNN